MFYSYLLTPTVFYSREYGVDRFCDSVCQQDKTKTAETKFAELGTEMVYHDTSPTSELLGQKVKSQVHGVTKKYKSIAASCY